ncbi:hypothetical protein NZK35_19845 [Stieleria sp. ICT_E10.1]|uniref:hypothetical protein n=1 Tax=Stieleria sedimenti TaxID=2976331 RepID=UPI00217FCA2B|nr:hypothetical protein [Stieleria sedimenti]MCS7468912.1 hypothetical protein [Stieleria sedimenti]
MASSDKGIRVRRLFSRKSKELFHAIRQGADQALRQGDVQDNDQSRRDRNTSLNADGSIQADASLDSGLDVDASGSASTDADLDGALDN